MKLELAPVFQDEAFDLIYEVHRHLDDPEGWLGGVGLVADGLLVGAGILSRPVAPWTASDRRICEITRVAVPEGIRNGSSKLYAALRDMARSQGYWKVQTFTLPSESGASLRGAGFVLVRPWEQDTPRKPGQWASNRRHPSLFGPEPLSEAESSPKNRWECVLRAEPDFRRPAR